MSLVEILQPFLLPVVVGAVGYASFEARRYFETRCRRLRLLVAFYDGRFESLRVERKKSAIEQFFIAGKYAADTADVAFTVVDGYLREKGYPMRLPKPDSAPPQQVEASRQADAAPALTRADSDDDDGRTKTHD
ncbi:hypothetical protein FIU94_18290 (plasmid) [Sulfitobacter sp. THAF37]|uniref:hypothetical protein n=1 Tax=Sulfitobacter sp. THAF37 TaxID=2587855 RepID=UPI001269802A|nr:hypothetical protein [Sulfitobacter sp. THAF37]QFT60788.1 hypothetical protein FIU94_18290 [Sulfitobacter sp. THAF37]